MTDATATPRGVPARLISLVLPVHDEQDSLDDLYRQICETLARLPDRAEMIFVDDGSTDRSFEVLRALAARDARVRVVRLRRNFGKAAAYSAGFDASRGDVVIAMDTDLQDDPAEIPLFLREIDAGHDMVIGWKHTGKGPLAKSLPSRFFNSVVRRMTGIPLHDFNCPFKAYRAEVLREIRVYGELHRYIPVLAAARGFTLAEVAIRNLPRRHGHSHYGVERYWRGMLDLLTVIFVTRFAKRPAHLLAVGGLVAGALGVAILSFLVAAHVMYVMDMATSRWMFRDRPAISLGILLIIVGIQFLVTGLLGELIVIGNSSKGIDTGYSVRQTIGEPPDQPPPVAGG